MLKVLFLLSSSIHMVSSFQFPAGLPNLDLHENPISNLPIRLFGNRNHLQKLVRNRNKLKILDAQIFHNKTELNNLSLEGKNWHCHCELTFFNNSLEYRSLTQALEKARCSTS